MDRVSEREAARETAERLAIELGHPFPVLAADLIEAALLARDAAVWRETARMASEDAGKWDRTSQFTAERLETLALRFGALAGRFALGWRTASDILAGALAARGEAQIHAELQQARIELRAAEMGRGAWVDACNEARRERDQARKELEQARAEENVLEHAAEIMERDCQRVTGDVPHALREWAKVLRQPAPDGEVATACAKVVPGRDALEAEPGRLDYESGGQKSTSSEAPAASDPDDSELCEGCKATATCHDSDGIPLCAACMRSLVEDSSPDVFWQLAEDIDAEYPGDSRSKEVAALLRERFGPLVAAARRAEPDVKTYTQADIYAAEKRGLAWALQEAQEARTEVFAGIRSDHEKAAREALQYVEECIKSDMAKLDIAISALAANREKTHD